MNLGVTECAKWYNGSDGVGECNIGCSGLVVRYLFNKPSAYRRNIIIVIDIRLRKNSWSELGKS